jgi:succinate dehydrogenase flavin-adding protein (antitoxin of CptAB toxin-antitoxin module)
MSERKSSLGRGAASIFSGVPQLSEDDGQLSDAEKQPTERLLSDAEAQRLKDEGGEGELHQLAAGSVAESQQSIVAIQRPKDETQSIDMAALGQAIDEGMKNPKITVYSPIIASFMRYKEITIPRFKLSPEAEGRLEKILKREDSDLWKAIEEGVQWSKKKESQRLKEEVHSIDTSVVEQSIVEGMKYPKVTIYSPIIAGFLRYMELTTPRFKLSPAVESRLDKVLKREDPELWKAIEEKISWKKRKR